MDPGIDRSPGARLKRARELYREWANGPCMDYEDPVVVEYARFLHERSRLDGNAIRRLYALRPVLAELQYLIGDSGQIRAGRERASAEVGAESDGMRRDRALIKAYVLCDMPPEEIAEELGFHAETVEFFEYLAWDVRSRLHNRSYIHNYVLRDGAVGPIHHQDFEMLWLHEAYANGLESLQQFLMIKPSEPVECANRIAKEVSRDLAQKTKLATLQLRPTSHTIPEMISGYNSYRKADSDIRHKDGGGLGSPNSAVSTKQTQEYVAGVVSGMSLSVGSSIVDSESDDLPAEERSATDAFEAALAEVLGSPQSEGS